VTGGAPDPVALARVVAPVCGPGTVEGLRRLSGGASRETWTFELAAPDGARHGLVLRRDPGSHTGWSERATEYMLLEATAAAGVPVPRVRVLLGPDDDLGHGFVMDRVDGETIPRRILRDDVYADARPLLAAQCGEIAARIHATDAATLPELPVQSAAFQIAQYRENLDGFGEPHPAFELGLRWLADNTPPEAAKPALVHGDFRNGNLIVDSTGLRGVLDWELAHFGDPIEDLGWLCVRSWRFGEDAKPVGGFGTRAELFAAYEAAGGGAVDPERVRFWEIYGTVRWGVICVIQAGIHLRGEVRSVELAAIGRRAAETEHDLLDLLGVPPATVAPAPLELETGQDRPSLPEGIDAVAELLEQMMGADDLTANTRFHLRVAVRLLRILEREARLGLPNGRADRLALGGLLGTPDASLGALLRSAAAGLRDGSVDSDDALPVLRDIVARKLAIANPDYGRGTIGRG
jgi:aminoglycoside phosphotransferase (APT) family kinase protein